MRWEPGDEIERTRFFQRVVYGPDLDFCRLWVGALGDDSYGRFWIAQEGHQIVVRPHRYALAVELERGLDDEVAMHRRCDNPLRVNTGDGDSFAAHVVLASAAENMADMGRKGRGGAVGCGSVPTVPNVLDAHERCARRCCDMAGISTRSRQPCTTGRKERCGSWQSIVF